MMFITVHSSEENTWTSNSKQFVDTNKDEKAIFFFFGFVLFETAFLYEKALKNFIFFKILSGILRKISNFHFIFI